MFEINFFHLTHYFQTEITCSHMCMGLKCSLLFMLKPFFLLSVFLSLSFFLSFCFTGCVKQHLVFEFIQAAQENRNYGVERIWWHLVQVSCCFFLYSHMCDDYFSAVVWNICKLYVIVNSQNYVISGFFCEVDENCAVGCSKM